LALPFLVFWPALRRATRHVIAHRQAWVGDADEIAEQAAEGLSGEHPLAATVPIRAMVGFALGMGRAKCDRLPPSSYASSSC
jgi:hypothetical protein